MSHHYAIVAAKLVEQCLEQIQSVIDSDERSKRLHPSNSSLYDMKFVFAEIESHLLNYFSSIIVKEVEASTSPQVHEKYKAMNLCSLDLRSNVEFLEYVLKEASIAAAEHAGHPAHSYYPRRSATDSLLFRLNVALQLCLVRIDDARLVVCGERYQQPIRKSTLSTSSHLQTSTRPYIYITLAGMLGATTLLSVYKRPYPKINVPQVNLRVYLPLIQNSSKAIAALFTLRWIHQKWSNMWMTTKLVKSTEEIEDWIRQWILVQSTPAPKLQNSKLLSTQQQQPEQPQLLPTANSTDTTMPTTILHDNNNSLDAARSRRLIEYALHETTKHTFWYSQGELRFLMVKRAMDVFYASVGTAMDLTGGGGSNSKKGDHATTGTTGNVKQHESAKWQLTLVTAAVASFYSVIGARDKASAVTSSSESASYLIRNAWGMVSLPAVKTLSLQASRLIKGAAVADRIEICGVSCFILSSDPAPELAAAIKRSHRSNYQRRLKPIARLSTIDEQEEHEPNDHVRRCCNTSSFVRSSSRRYRQRDVIFHLTGGGFFAHIHSTDLPYLLDWSAATGAVVICPEYALLPEHTFPVALNQVEEVFEALLSDEAVTVLGFETNRIIVTGESAGGNLAASMCVKIITEEMNMRLPIDNNNNYQLISKVPMESDVPPVHHDENFDADNRYNEKKKVVRLPDALMLSCPVLNLSLEMSHSRVIGTNDPVLPSGLISAISDAYIPPMLGISKKDPLASPFYASNEILRHFPSTLLFASSNDPLLDDSVVFNQRLREHGVDSDLIAAHNLPHAYLGLGTAGFPEAKQIQEQCITWLNQQFAKKRS